jgi:hypothetical protein
MLVSEYLSAFLILVRVRRQHCLFSHREMNSLGIKLNNLYTGTCCLYGAGRNDLMRANPFRGSLKGVGPKNQDFFDP